MKKFVFAAALAAMASVFAADEKDDAKKEADAKNAPPPELVAEAEKAEWPVPVEFVGMRDIDVTGIRFTIPWHVEAESVTGFDVGFFGRCRYFEGLQLSVLRNDVKDSLAGVQVGLYNSTGRADLFGMQIGLFNQAHSLSGMQIGLVNIVDEGSGIQVGLINRADGYYGFQVGGINVIRESDLAFFPVLNVGFDLFSRY